MSWIEPQGSSSAEADPLIAHAKGIIDHMNEDNADTLPLYAEAFSRAGALPEAVMTGEDRYGFEMSVTTDQGPRPFRIAFETPVKDTKDVRMAMVAMLKQARENLGRG